MTFLCGKRSSKMSVGIGAIRKWQASRGKFLGPTPSVSTQLIGTGSGVRVCERIIVFNKRDLVPDWGFEVYSSKKVPLNPWAYLIIAALP